jgi:hypothetical protein
MTDPENTGQEQADTKFKPGVSGNPAGRPKGSRSKLGEAFLKELLDDWEKNGIEALRKMRDERPHEYIKVVASILPKELTGEDGGPIPLAVIERHIVRPSHTNG